MGSMIIPTESQSEIAVKDSNITLNGFLHGFGYLYFNRHISLLDAAKYLSQVFKEKLGYDVSIGKTGNETAPDGWVLNHLDIYSEDQIPLMRIENPQESGTIFRIMPYLKNLLHADRESGRKNIQSLLTA